MAAPANRVWIVLGRYAAFDLEGAAYVDVLQPLATEVVIGLVYAVVVYLVWRGQNERARRAGSAEFF